MSAVFYVNRLGISTIEDSNAECRRLLEAATPPIECGPRMVAAPARGPMLRFQSREMVQTESGAFVSRRAGFNNWDTARVADVFDLMADAARKAHIRRVQRAKAAGEPEPGFVEPFTPGQVEIGRDYAALTERCDAAGVKCSSLETLRERAGTGGDREAAIFRDFERLRAMHRRIGYGLAKDVRRLRPQGQQRKPIYVRRLVDLVCLGGLSLSGVLDRHGWSASEKSILLLRVSLCAALDRMQGYSDRQAQNVD